MSGFKKGFTAVFSGSGIGGVIATCILIGALYAFLPQLSPTGIGTILRGAGGTGTA